ncbi:DUF4912 domain-containing protein [Sporohalobacter salinus]|uniref:DUF4912 domain-containing protein n=1 Tax=Sporohalobacter salinus TaxID=1494606 RepID=UPI00195FF8D9|nr:DUF4912 domain-containing protein [Sporohalobacter salinus]MBM7624195.1 hypothetical protein [Sporohalobacter salinus]
MSTNLGQDQPEKMQTRPAIEAIKPNIEFFETYDYPELANYNLETSFHQNRITALVRDPYWIYLYWEINELFETSGQPVLKVLDITNLNYPHASPHDYFTVDIDLAAENWYLKMPAANRKYTVELGLQRETGDFNLLARSNYFTTPRDKPSDKYDPEWMTIDALFRRSYPHSNSDGTLNTGSSPLGAKEFPGIGINVSSPLGPEEYVSSPGYVSSPQNGDW